MSTLAAKEEKRRGCANPDGGVVPMAAETAFADGLLSRPTDDVLVKAPKKVTVSYNAERRALRRRIADVIGTLYLSLKRQYRRLAAFWMRHVWWR